MSELLFSPERLAAYVQAVPMVPPEVEEPRGRLSRLSLGAILAGNIGDAASTIYGLNRGAREANPVYGDAPSAPMVAAIKGLGTLGQIWALQRLAREHPRAANLTAKLIAGGLGAVTANNVIQARRQR